jgi:hypothetical protein
VKAISRGQKFRLPGTNRTVENFLESHRIYRRRQHWIHYRPVNPAYPLWDLDYLHVAQTFKHPLRFVWSIMAPNLTPPQLELIHHMIQSNSLTTSEMAYAADCSKQSIVRIRSNLKVFGNVRAPRNSVGRPRSITPPMLEALREHLTEKPTLYQDEMALFLWDEFRKHVTI